ncbi:MAG: hypothetical protein MJZ05_00565 [Fibrobacter sp.]|nr:hypothetical protein [Fibrobacter sp.]
MKKFGLVTLALSAAAFAGPLTWEQLIQSVDNDPRYQAAQKRAEMTSTGQNTKLWDKLELRYKLDGFSFAQHDFELRITPKGFGEGSADKAHWEAQVAYQKAHLIADRAELLYDRYDRAIHYINRQRIAKLNKELYQVNSDRIEVLHMKAGSATFNPQDLMTSLEKEASLRAEMMTDSASLLNAEAKLKLWVPDFDGVELDSTWIPSMDEVAAQLEGGLEINETFPAIAMAAGKMKSEKSKIQQDASKSRDYISHIGIGYSLKIESLMEKYKDLDAYDIYGTGSYDAYRGEFEKQTGCVSQLGCTATARVLIPDVDNRKTSDKFFANLAFRLPFFDSNKDSDLKTQVAELDAEGDYMKDFRDVSQKVTKLVDEINALIAQWKVQKEFVEKVNAGSIFEQFAKNAGSDPLLLLRARESALESDLRAIKLENDIFTRYLALLEYAGVLGAEGVQNHLQKGLR